MTRKENEPPEDNYPDGVLMIFAGTHPQDTKATLERAKKAWNNVLLDPKVVRGSDTWNMTVQDLRVLNDLIRQIDG